MDGPFIATVQIAGPFDITASPLWIKSKDRESAVTGEQIERISVKDGSSDPNTTIEHIIDGSGISDIDKDDLLEHSAKLNDMWQSSKGRTAGWIEFDLGAVYKLGAIKVWNFNVQMQLNKGLKKADISVWTEDKGWQKIRDDVELFEAEGNDDYDEPTLVRLDGVEATKVRFDNLENLGDAEYIGLSEVQFFEVRGPKAVRPRPADKSLYVDVTDLLLKWVPGLDATTHNLYFGTDSNNLKLLGKIEDAIGVKLSRLATNTTYFWRIDEIQKDGSVVTGELWNFTTIGLIGWWKFDEADGSVAKDSSGRGNDAELQSNAVLQPDAGKFGGAVKLEGGTSFVEIPTKDMSASMGTIVLWAKLSQEQELPDHRYFFGHTTEPYYSNRIQLYMDKGLTMLDLGMGYSHETKLDMIKLEVETWYQIALSWREGIYVVYLNGKKLATGDYSGLENVNDFAYIGNNGRPPSRDQSFNGLIDDVRIYSYALSEADVAVLYSGKELSAADEVTIEIVKTAPELMPEVKSEKKQISDSRTWRAVLVVGIVAAIAIVLIISRKKTTV